MLPEKQYNEKISIIKIPSKTFKADFEKNKIKGVFNQIDALIQTIYKILITERYVYEIYNWNYGIEIDDLLGMPKEYVKTEIEKRIKDTLSIDDRIEKVYGFTFEDIKNDKCSLFVKFYVQSIFGGFDFGLEV